MDRIYMDYAATTPVDQSVLEKMLPYLTNKFGNPSSVYAEGRETKKALDIAREQVKNAIGAKQDSEIFFTSGATEADNTAIFGFCRMNRKNGNHIITSAIEHHAVLHCFEKLEKDGFDVTYLPVDEYGFISLDDLKNAISEQTIFISIMTANNEIGTIQPVSEIGKIAKERGVIFHTDAVQAISAMDIDVVEMNIDMLSLSGHKIYGAKGAGALYVRRGVKFEPLIYGGAQEKMKRGGTENVAAIVGLGHSIERIRKGMDERNRTLSALRDRLIDGLLDSIPSSRLNGPRENRLPNNVNISFEFVEGEGMLLSLDFLGIAASSGSACTSGSLDPSHVLLAIGLPHEKAHGSLRLSLGDSNTDADVDKVLLELPKIVSNLRAMSPLFDLRDDMVVYEGSGH